MSDLQNSELYALPPGPRGVVLSLCDRTGVMVEPWLEAGYDAIIVDLQHTTSATTGANGARLTKVNADVREWSPPYGPYAAVFAFPPCTDLANSGARWFREKGMGALIEALQIVDACRGICEASGAPWMLENPVGQLATYWRPPDFRFDPYEYAGWCDDPDEDAYTKRTCLWVGGGFQLPLRRRREAVHGSKMHLLAPSEDRADRRSVTPRGFARAVFEANAPRIVDSLAAAGAHSDQGTAQ